MNLLPNIGQEFIIISVSAATWFKSHDFSFKSSFRIVNEEQDELSGL